eukprot:358565-Chlamydomonas_euryale.AAC.6
MHTHTHARTHVPLQSCVSSVDVQATRHEPAPRRCRCLRGSWAMGSACGAAAHGARVPTRPTTSATRAAAPRPTHSPTSTAASATCAGATATCAVSAHQRWGGALRPPVLQAHTKGGGRRFQVASQSAHDRCDKCDRGWRVDAAPQPPAPHTHADVFVGFRQRQSWAKKGGEVPACRYPLSECKQRQEHFRCRLIVTRTPKST